VITSQARYLPHYYEIGHPIFITWRLHNSLPSGRTFPPSITSGKAFLTVDCLLDNAVTGHLHLRRLEIAALVLESIHYRDRILRNYDLHSYVVMRITFICS
jgi:hypothetical protein